MLRRTNLDRAMRPWLRYHANFALGCAAAVLAGCASTQTVATFQTEDATISLQQSTRDGSYSVSVAPHTSLPLDGYTSAHIDSIWSMSGSRVIVIGGAGTDCPLRYTLVIAASDTASRHSIGDCGDNYSFARNGNTLAIRQTGVRDPKLWTVNDGILDGPTIQVARPSGPQRRAVPARPGENVTDATSVPAVSAPVGDEVIPSPVGGSGSDDSRPNAVPRF
jgi:hypothetical protein